MAHNRLVPETGAFEPLVRAVPAFVIGLIFAEVRFRPHCFQERGKSFIEPDVAPVFAGDEIAEPLVAELVRDQVVFAGEVLQSEFGMNEGFAGVGGGARILHAAGDEIIHHDLRVFFPGIVHAECLAEEFHHGRSASIVDGEAVAATLWCVIGHGNTAPGLFHLIEFAGDDGDQVGRAGDRFFPIPGFQTLAGVADADKFSVRNGDPGSRNSEDCFGREAIIGIVVRRQVVMGVFRFALRPDLTGTVRIVLVRQNEIHSLRRLAFVANGDVEFVSGLGLSGEGNDQFLCRRFKFRRRLVYRDFLNGEPGRVENNFCGTVAKNGE